MEHTANDFVSPETMRIRELNDALRNNIHTCHGVLFTDGICAWFAEGGQFYEMVDAVKNFNTFTEENDPHGEHDFGKVTFGSTDIFWKIDYYDLDLVYRSPDPSDPTVTTRVMTIMLAEEY